MNIKELSNILYQASVKINTKLYFVGKFVTYKILGFKCLDIDIAVTQNIKEFVEYFCSKNTLSYTYYPDYYIYRVAYNNSIHIDFINPTIKVYVRPSSPTYYPSTLLNDLKHRDFTIQSMALKILDNKLSLVDPFNGYESIKKKEIRICYGDAYKDDPTRIILGAIYEQHYGFQFSEYDKLMMQYEMKKLRDVDSEILSKIMTKVYNNKYSSTIIKRLKDLGVDKYISLKENKNDNI